jgi:hypothetical protein
LRALYYHYRDHDTSFRLTCNVQGFGLKPTNHVRVLRIFIWNDMFNIKILHFPQENDDILYVNWIDYDPFMKFNFEMYFFSIIETISKNNIKKIVLDASSRKYDPSDKDFKAIFELFLSGLSATNLQKMARISAPNPAIWAKFNKMLDQIADNLNLNFQVRNFNNEEEAMAWLKEENYSFKSNIQKSA